MGRLTQLLASALLAVGHHLDPHQAVACLQGLTSPACILNPSLQVAPLNRLLLMLLAGEGQAAALRRLHPQELADVAAAAAAMQLAAVQQQREQEEEQQQQGVQLQQPGSQQLQLIPNARQQAAAKASRATQQLAVYDAVDNSSSDSSNSDAGPLALLSPLQQLWTQLALVALPQLQGSFSFDMLALFALSYARAGQADSAFINSITNAALSKAGKFTESPAAVVQLLQALALASSKSSSSSTASVQQQQLLDVLGAAISQRKALYSPQQLTDAAAAFAQLKHYNETACLAICKVASRSLKYWPAPCIVTLLGALAKLRFRDEVLLRAAVKVLPGKVAAGGLSGQQLADVLASLLQLSYTAPDLEQLVTAVMG
jgi:hypothetical protein